MAWLPNATEPPAPTSANPATTPAMSQRFGMRSIRILRKIRKTRPAGPVPLTDPAVAFAVQRAVV
jgi:hypothetical protein